MRPDCPAALDFGLAHSLWIKSKALMVQGENLH